MRLVSFRLGGAERLGVELMDGRLAPVASLGEGLPATMATLLAGGPGALEALRRALAAGTAEAVALAPGSLERLAPVPRPGKVIAIGLNYYDHAREGGAAVPDEPMIFAKFATSIVGDGATVEWDPGLTDAVDLEAELGVVIGRTARRVAESEALGCVFGYTCINDVSARDLQFKDKQFVRAKSLDSFGPMGPVLVTADKIPDPGNLAIRSLLNGGVAQDSSTSNLIFSVPRLIAHCSRAFTLEPGDIISTGTPAGVLWYREPKGKLKDGDEMVIEIEGIGRLTNRCREVRPS